MVSTSKKFVAAAALSLFLLAGFFSAPLNAKPKHQMVWRKWVVKLKANSWTNKRPFQFAAPVTDGETVFVGVHRGIFYAVHARRGKKLWHVRTQGPIHARAALTASRVFVADAKGFVYAFNKKDGHLEWQTSIGGEMMSAPLVHENKLYIVTLAKELAALNLQDGTILWKRTYGSRDLGFTVRGAADPVLVGGNLLVGYSDGTLAAHDPETGNVRWVKNLGDRVRDFHDVDATLVAAGDLAYLASADGKLFALHPGDGSVVWQAQTGGVNEAAPADSFLYATADGIIHCFQADTGQILWEQDLQVPELSSPAVYGPWLVVVATQGKMYFLDRKTGDITNFWHVKGGSFSDPVMDGKWLYLLSNSARLYRFEFKESL